MLGSNPGNDCSKALLDSQVESKNTSAVTALLEIQGSWGELE